MRAKFLTSLIATTAAIATAFMGGAAEAGNLKTSDSAFYDLLVNDYLLATDEKDMLDNYDSHILDGYIQAIEDSVEVFLIDIDPYQEAMALYENRLTYTINDGATQDAFEGRRVDDYPVRRTGTREVALGEGFTIDLELGDILDFKLVSQPNVRDTNIFGADATLNPDQLQHVVAYEIQHDGFNWLYLGWEDILGGGDLDFNDAAVVLKNVIVARDPGEDPIIIPEPGVTLALIGVATGAMGLRRRKTDA